MLGLVFGARTVRLLAMPVVPMLAVLLACFRLVVTAVVAVADSTYAALGLLAACARLPTPVVVITRLRLDAALYDPAPARPPGGRLPGDHTGGATPVPIPNTAVKPAGPMIAPQA